MHKYDAFENIRDANRLIRRFLFINADIINDSSTTDSNIIPELLLLFPHETFQPQFSVRICVSHMLDNDLSRLTFDVAGSAG
jgi:hypothetical protein